MGGCTGVWAGPSGPGSPDLPRPTNPPTLKGRASQPSGPRATLSAGSRFPRCRHGGWGLHYPPFLPTSSVDAGLQSRMVLEPLLPTLHFRSPLPLAVGPAGVGALSAQRAGGLRPVLFGKCELDPGTASDSPERAKGSARSASETHRQFSGLSPSSGGRWVAKRGDSSGDSPALLPSCSAYGHRCPGAADHGVSRRRTQLAICGFRVCSDQWPASPGEAGDEPRRGPAGGVWRVQGKVRASLGGSRQGTEP